MGRSLPHNARTGGVEASPFASIPWTPAFAVKVTAFGSILAGGGNRSVVRSDDGGDTRTDFSDGLGDDAVKPGALRGIVLATIASVQARGAFISDDDGPWRQMIDAPHVDASSFNSMGVIFVGARGLFKSTDKGGTWSQMADFYVTAIAHSTNDDIFIATSTGIYRSAVRHVLAAREDRGCSQSSESYCSPEGG